MALRVLRLRLWSEDALGRCTARTSGHNPEQPATRMAFRSIANARSSAMPSSMSTHDLPSGAPSLVVKEEHIEYGFIGKLQNLKYEYRDDIRDRAALEKNFREKFEALNRVKLTESEFARLLDEIVTPDVYTAAKTLRRHQASNWGNIFSAQGSPPPPCRTTTHRQVPDQARHPDHLGEPKAPSPQDPQEWAGAAAFPFSISG